MKNKMLFFLLTLVAVFSFNAFGMEEVVSSFDRSLKDAIEKSEEVQVNVQSESGQSSRVPSLKDLSAEAFSNETKKDFTFGQLLQKLKNYPEDYPHQKRLASKIGKSERWVSEYLAILDFRLSTIPEEKLRDLTHIKAAEIRSASNQKRQRLIQQIIDTGEIPSRREIIRVKKTLINTYHCPNCDADREEWQTFSSQDGLRCMLCKTLVELVKTEEPQEPTQPIEEVEDVMMPIPLFKPSRLMDAFAEAQFESSLERLVGEGKIPSSGQNGIPISISTSWPNRCWVNEKIAIYLDDEEITEEGKDLNRKFDEVLIGRGWTVIREKYSSTMDEKALALVMGKLEKTFQKYKRIN